MPKPNRRSQRKSAKGSRVRSIKLSTQQKKRDEMIEASENGTNLNRIERNALQRSRGNGDSGRLLMDPAKLKQDLTMLRNAVAKGYHVTRKGMLRRRLEAIVAKEKGEVMTKEGLVDSETKADELAIAATKVLVLMDAADLKRLEHFEDKPVVPPQVGITIHGDNTTVTSSPVDRRTIELAELANAIGAKELVIDGRAVPVSELLGSTVRVPEEVQVPAERSDLPAADSTSSKASGVSDFDLRGSLVRGSSRRRQD